MPPVIFVIPGNLSLPTGGYAYDGRVLDLAERHGVDMRHLALPGSYPAPTDADLEETARLIAATPRDAILLIDGLAYGAMPADLIRSFNRRIVALVHHPLGLESGIGAARAKELIANEKTALAFAEMVIVTSKTTAKTLTSDFAVPQEKLAIAEPGVDYASRAKGSADEETHILAVGSLTPRKGYDVLIDALARVADLPWTLSIAGAADRAPATVNALRGLIEKRGFKKQIALLGAVETSALDSLYGSADIFVISSLYEGYGMVATEAIAHGLPIVSTTGGALAETVPDDVAIKVPPADVDALANALRRMMIDPDLRKRCADAAWARAATLPRWDDTAATIAGVLKNLMAGDKR